MPAAAGEAAASVPSVTNSTTWFPTVVKCSRWYTFLLIACIRHLWATFEALPSVPRSRIPSIVVVNVGMAKAETTRMIAITTISSTRLNPALTAGLERAVRHLPVRAVAPSNSTSPGLFGIALMQLRNPRIVLCSGDCSSQLQLMIGATAELTHVPEVHRRT